jgi:ribose/xylose/arabinose/galactoside ABC-type transport system permease subunit
LWGDLATSTSRRFCRPARRGERSLRKLLGDEEAHVLQNRGDTRQNNAMRRALTSVVRSQQFGLVVVILLLGLVLTVFAGNHVNGVTGKSVNNFLNPDVLIGMATFASYIAIMAVGMTMVVITAGIDLSVGSTFALAGVLTAMVLDKLGLSGVPAVVVGAAVCAGIGLLAGVFNGALITSLGVHPFIITLGSMWIFRGVAYVASGGQSILFPHSLTNFAKANVGFGGDVTPVPMLLMLLIAVLGSIFLTKTVAGRRVFAVGGNLEASRYSGVPINRILISVYAITGLTAGIGAFIAGSYFGAAQSADGTGYELYVIASAVVGGASLAGGKGSAISAMLGALLIAMIQQSIRTLHLNPQYEYIIIGCAIIIAVVLDRVSARLGSARLAQSTR